MLIIASQTSSYGFHQQKQKNEGEKDISGYLIFSNPLSTQSYSLQHHLKCFILTHNKWPGYSQ